MVGPVQRSGAMSFAQKAAVLEAHDRTHGQRIGEPDAERVRRRGSDLQPQVGDAFDPGALGAHRDVEVVVEHVVVDGARRDRDEVAVANAEIPCCPHDEPVRAKAPGVVDDERTFGFEQHPLLPDSRGRDRAGRP